MSNLVYSTEGGRICPVCQKPLTQCVCAAQAAARPLGDGRVRVQRETQGRGGKAVTVVRGLALNAEALVAMGKQLKAVCGSGGTVKDGQIELQGDHVERVLEYLKKKGLTAKRGGA